MFDVTAVIVDASESSGYTCGMFSTSTFVVRSGTTTVLTLEPDSLVSITTSEETMRVEVAIAGATSTATISFDMTSLLSSKSDSLDTVHVLGVLFVRTTSLQEGI